MRLLFDANLSPRLVALTAGHFPGSVHVFDCGEIHRDDRLIWSYAKGHGLAVVSKDSDFQQMSILFGAPPKVIWIRAGNASTDDIAMRLFRDVELIVRFDADAEASLLIL